LKVLIPQRYFEALMLKNIGSQNEMIATETTEDTEGKYSVLSVYSVA